jgi:hypothetical protein
MLLKLLKAVCNIKIHNFNGFLPIKPGAINIIINHCLGTEGIVKPL